MTPHTPARSIPCASQITPRKTDASLSSWRKAAGAVAANVVAGPHADVPRGGSSGIGRRRGVLTPADSVSSTPPRRTPAHGRTRCTPARRPLNADSRTPERPARPCPHLPAVLDSTGEGRHKVRAGALHPSAAVTAKARGESGILSRVFADLWCESIAFGRPFTNANHCCTTATAVRHDAAVTPSGLGSDFQLS